MIARPIGRKANPAAQRSEVEDVLQVQRQEIPHREEGSPDQQHDHVAPRHAANLEEGEGDKRLAAAQLPGEESGQEHGRDDEPGNRTSGRPWVLVGPDDRVHEHGQAGGHRDGAADVEALASRAPGLGQIGDGHERRRDSDRDVDEQDPAPRELGGEDAAQQDAGGSGGATRGTPQPQRARASLGPGENVVTMMVSVTGDRTAPPIP